MKTRQNNLALLTGAAAVLLIAVSILIEPSVDGPPGDAQEVADLYLNDTNAVLLAGILGVLGAALLFWFAGAIRMLLLRDRGAESSLPSTAFGGAIGATVSLLVGEVMVISQALRAQDELTNPDIVASFDDLATHLFGIAMPICASALVGAVALASIRSANLLPKAVAYSSIALAVLMVIPPVAFIGNLVFLVWLLGVSAYLGTRASASADAAGAAAPSADRHVGAGV
jgi:hypothetical protein